MKNITVGRIMEPTIGIPRSERICTPTHPTAKITIVYFRFFLSKSRRRYIT